MFSPKVLALLFVLLSSFSAAQHCRKVDIDNSSGFCTVPDASLTPGEMDASLACVSNADRPRAVSDSEKNQILAAYGWPSTTNVLLELREAMHEHIARARSATRERRTALPITERRQDFQWY